METRKRKLDAINVDKDEDILKENIIPDYSCATSKVYEQQAKQVLVVAKPIAITQMIMMDDELWCASATNCIYILDQDCNQVRKIELNLIIKIYSLTFSQRGSVLIAGIDNGGLHEIDLDGGYKSEISKGSFAGISTVTHNGYFFNIDCTKNIAGKGKVQCYMYKELRSSKKWVKEYEFIFSKCHGVNHCDKIATVDTKLIYVSSIRQHCIYCYNNEGALLSQLGESGYSLSGELWSPFICDVDYLDNILIADSKNRKIQICDSEKSWHVLNIEPNVEHNINQVVISADTNTIWVATWENTVYKYVNRK